jgi:hypothetical protein
MTSNHTRRSFLIHSAGSFLVPAFSSAVPLPVTCLHVAATPIARSCRPIAPLYCVAYITPDAPGQGGQEAIVARYPMAIVDQDNRDAFRIWRDAIRTLNPDIVFLGYQMVQEETSAPGPGNDELRKALHSWCKYPNGFEPTTFYGHHHHRLYDVRTPEFEECFLNACRKVLLSYPYDGLFLDNCTVFNIATPIPSIHSEMIQALQGVLLKLRQEFPEALIVGNSSESWLGLNGEMNEGRRAQLESQIRSSTRHTSPIMNMYQTILKNAQDIATVRADLKETLDLGAFYGASVDYQHVLWFDEFDNVLKTHS